MSVPERLDPPDDHADHSVCPHWRDPRWCLEPCECGHVCHAAECQDDCDCPGYVG